MRKNSISAILDQIKSLAKPGNREGMARFGIRVDDAFGVSIYELRKIAKELGTDHELALGLWETGNHEARILAGMIDDPDLVTETQMERWVGDFNSWDMCDQVCSNLFDRTKYAYKKAIEWTKRDEEFVKRAGFVLMAALSVHDKNAVDSKFEKFFPIIERHATDERNFVKKAVNWALRQIGKRNVHLNKKAIDIAERIGKTESKTARWIAKDALKELRSDKVRKKLQYEGNTILNT
jgi:3-methyladenine DNA glycosylase AlkD